jgi:hypothetical protein
MDNLGRNARPADIISIINEAISSIKHDLITKHIENFTGRINVWKTDELPPIKKHDNITQFDRELLDLSRSFIIPEKQKQFRKIMRSYVNACYAYDLDPENFMSSESYTKYPHTDHYDRPEHPTFLFDSSIDTAISMSDYVDVL